MVQAKKIVTFKGSRKTTVKFSYLSDFNNM